jgi:hypothetical protein
VTLGDRERTAARVMLAAMADDGFVLAGSSALSEHGLMSRPPHDIDLFTTMPRTTDFDGAVTRGVDALQRHGYGARELRRSEQFARYQVTEPDGHVFEVDMGIDWRAHEPVATDIGPMLSEEDAVAGKMSAVYTRADPKDLVDLDTIRRSGRYADAELLRIAQVHDPGFEPQMFGRIVQTIQTMKFDENSVTGVSTSDLEGVRARLSRWGSDLAAGRTGASPELDLARASYPHSPRHAPRLSPSAADVAAAYRGYPGRNAGRGR